MRIFLSSHTYTHTSFCCFLKHDCYFLFAESCCWFHFSLSSGWDIQSFVASSLSVSSCRLKTGWNWWRTTTRTTTLRSRLQTRSSPTITNPPQTRWVLILGPWAFSWGQLANVVTVFSSLLCGCQHVYTRISQTCKYLVKVFTFSAIWYFCFIYY